jgi:hypothetical protein
VTAADAIPVGLGIASGLALGAWALADRLQAISHDRMKQRLVVEEDDHDLTRAELARAKKQIIDLESRLAQKSDAS